MLYEKLFTKLERIRWNMETDIPWEQVKPHCLTEYQKESIRNICLTEVGSLFAAEAFIRDFYDDIDFSCFVSIWYYEEMKHTLVLKRYLSAVGVQVADSEFQHMRMSIPPSDKQTILMIHFLSEHRLAMWYRGISHWLSEPVGKEIFRRIADDELRHANSYFEYIKKDLLECPTNLYRYLRAAAFMLNPKAPNDTHAVTITKTTDMLEEPHYMSQLEGALGLEASKTSTSRRVFALLSALSQDEIKDYKTLSRLVKQLKQTA
jgi:demethoxyubiquinone hydroxylase (CLK1/Coq7/Cat5 family)